MYYYFKWLSQNLNIISQNAFDKFEIIYQYLFFRILKKQKTL